MPRRPFSRLRSARDVILAPPPGPDLPWARLDASPLADLRDAMMAARDLWSGAAPAETARAYARARTRRAGTPAEWARQAIAEEALLDAESAEAMLRNPGPLGQVPGPAPLLVASGPGRHYEAWGHAAAGVWYAFLSERDPAGADPAGCEEMTAAQLRGLLAERAGR